MTEPSHEQMRWASGPYTIYNADDGFYTYRQGTFVRGDRSLTQAVAKAERDIINHADRQEEK